jgi:hypothetical protein
MRASRPAAIVADGRERILEGSAREARFRIRVRLMRRSQSIRERASLFGRLVVTFRIWRFIHRQMEKQAPGGACYSSRSFRATSLSSSVAFDAVTPHV